MNNFIKIFLHIPRYNNYSFMLNNLTYLVKPIFNAKDKPYHTYVINETNGSFSKNDYKESFEKVTGIPYNENNYLDWRLRQLNNSDCMIMISDSNKDNCSFEIGYNIANKNIPMFIGYDSEINKDNFIYNLKNYSNVIYSDIDDFKKYKDNLYTFISDVGRMNNVHKI